MSDAGRHVHGAYAIVAAVLVLGAVAAAGRGIKEVTASRVDVPPVLDGRLDDPCWRDSDVAEGFYLRMGAGDAPTQPTRAQVCYDDENLYVAIECLEDRMEDLSAAIAFRDYEEIGDDDVAIFSLDTFRDGRSSYTFCCNPLGTEKDFHASECGRSIDVGWDAVWSVATSRASDRWVAEFAVPFSALRYKPGNEMVWGIDFRRIERPHSEFSSWSNGDGHPLDASRFGELRGLSGIAPPVGLELRPFAMGKYDASELYEYPLEPSDSDWDVHPDAGLDVEYAPLPAVTLNLTLNPDFAQIEADPNQINLSGDELWLQERRPFFSENADVFHLPLNLLYTRRMEDIVYGGKVTGKLGGANFAGLAVRSDDLPRDEDGEVLTDEEGDALPVSRNDYGAFIVRQDLFGDATVGAFASTREREDGHNRTAALMAGVNVTEQLRLTGLAGQTTDTGPAPDDNAYALAWNYGGADMDSEGSITWIGEDFAPETGYVPVDWRGRIGGEGHVWKMFDIEDAPIDRVETVVWGGRFESVDGDLQEYCYGGEASVRFPNGVILGLESTRGYDARDYPVHPDQLLGKIYGVTSSTVWAGFTGSIEVGDFHGSNLLSAMLGGRLQPVEPLTIEFSTNGVLLREHEDLDWLIEDVRANYRFSNEMFLRGIARGAYLREATEVGEDRWHRYDLDLLYGWEFRPGSMFYVAYNQALERDAGRSELLDPVVVLKISYLMSL